MKRNRPVLKSRVSHDIVYLRKLLIGWSWYDLTKDGRFCEIDGINFRTEIGTHLMRPVLVVIADGKFLVIKQLTFSDGWKLDTFSEIFKSLNAKVVFATETHFGRLIDQLWMFDLPEGFIHTLVIPDMPEPSNDP